jgi:hypothetical protein
MVVSLAYVAAGDTEHFLTDAKVVLQRLVEQPAIRSLDAQQCATYLHLFPCVNPNFCSISVVTVAGVPVCAVAEAASRLGQRPAGPKPMRKTSRASGWRRSASSASMPIARAISSR